MTIIRRLTTWWRGQQDEEGSSRKGQQHRPSLWDAFECMRSQYFVSFSSLDRDGMRKIVRYVAANTYCSTVGDAALEQVRMQKARLTKLGQRSGFLFEVWHVHSFNKNAIALGSQLRASVTQPNARADAVVFVPEDPSTNDPSSASSVRSEVQFKRYATAKKSQRALLCEKYEGMQKVAPADHASQALNVQSRMRLDSVASDPITLSAIDKLSEEGGSLQRFWILPHALLEVGKAALVGAVLGCVGNWLKDMTRTRVSEETSPERDLEGHKGSSRTIAMAAAASYGAAWSAAWRSLEVCLECRQPGMLQTVLDAGVLAGMVESFLRGVSAVRARNRWEVAACTVEFGTCSLRFGLRKEASSTELSVTLSLATLTAASLRLCSSRCQRQVLDFPTSDDNRVDL